MGYKRNIHGGALCAAMLLGLAGPAPAKAGEPLIVTPLPDPDPGLVAVSDSKLTLTILRGTEEEQSVDDAVASFGRALGEAVLAQRQAIEARCRSAQRPNGTTLDRFAWAANCRYSRH
jgi:hypothetical protein